MHSSCLQFHLCDVDTVNRSQINFIAWAILHCAQAGFHAQNACGLVFREWRNCINYRTHRTECTLWFELAHLKQKKKLLKKTWVSELRGGKRRILFNPAVSPWTSYDPVGPTCAPGSHEIPRCWGDTLTLCFVAGFFCQQRFWSSRLVCRYLFPFVKARLSGVSNYAASGFFTEINIW